MTFDSKLFPLFCIAAIISIAFPSAAQDENIAAFRDWTSSEGKVLHGRLLRVMAKDKSVSFKMKNGKEYTFPIEKLADADQGTLLKWVKRNPHGIAAPSPPFRWPSNYSGSNSPVVNYEGFKEDRKAHLYTTKYFDFYIDRDISKSTVGKCVAVFDSIIGALDSLPLQLDAVPKAGRPRYEAILVADQGTYASLGGIPNSGGFFSPSRNLTVIPFRSLGIVRKGNNWVFDGNLRSFETLMHELTHHSMSHWVGLPTWFREGMADYMEAMPYRSGKFLFTNTGSAVTTDIRSKYERSMYRSVAMPGGQFAMVSPEKLFQVDRRTWNMTLSRDPAQGSRLYSSSLLLTYYFLHVDGNGDGANLIAWMHACRAAHFSKRMSDIPKLAEKHLVRGRSFAEIHEEIETAMSKKGLKVNVSNN